MDISRIILYFLIGGVMVSSSVIVAETGSPFLSGIAILFPSITVASAYFIGKSFGVAAVSTSLKSTAVTSIVVWLPYMISLAYLTPRIGVNKAIVLSMLVYLALAAVWIFVNNKYRII